MVAALRQHNTGFAAAGNLVPSAQFREADNITPRPALPGSLLVWCWSGDKNSGTTTGPTDTPNLPIDDRTANVSQAMAWGVADGGETTLAGTVAANIAGGQVWILEITDPDGTGDWARRSTVQLVDPGTDVTSVALGPAPAATQPGIGIAVVSCDSVNTAGTPSWTNGWVGHRVTPSGGGNAGQWGAVKTGIPAGATESTTFSRAGGTADQHSGWLVVFGRVPAPPVEGAGEAEFGELVASGSGLLRLDIPGSGEALMAALEAAGRGSDPPPTDLPLRAGAPVLGASWAAGVPIIGETWRAGEATIR